MPRRERLTGTGIARGERTERNEHAGSLIVEESNRLAGLFRTLFAAGKAEVIPSDDDGCTASHSFLTADGYTILKKPTRATPRVTTRLREPR